GDTVTLVVSKGPVLVAVPNVIGQQVGDARRVLEQAGFQVKVEEAFGGYFGTVRLQDPAGGQVPRGSVITLTVV
ncbi:MAG: PASTA domain-containing protein, partial [Dermatophilaceae bacterium]